MKPEQAKKLGDTVVLAMTSTVHVSERRKTTQHKSK